MIHGFDVEKPLQVPVEEEANITLSHDMYYDEDDSTVLPQEELCKGVEREMKFMNDLDVGDVIPRQEREGLWRTMVSSKTQ